MNSKLVCFAECHRSGLKPAGLTRWINHIPLSLQLFVLFLTVSIAYVSYAQEDEEQDLVAAASGRILKRRHRLSDDVSLCVHLLTAFTFS